MNAQVEKWCGVVRQGLKRIVRPASTSCSGLEFAQHKIIIMAQSQKTLQTGSPLPPLAAGTTRLYSMRFCPFAHRARLVLAHKGIKYETVNIHLGKKPEWFLEKNPNGEVPVLEKDGDIVYDSLVVAEYLDEVYTENRLVPAQPLRKAHDAMVINYNGSKFVPNYYKVLGSKGEDPEPIAALMAGLQKLEEFLSARKTKFFGGDQPAFVDLMIWPWQERLTVLGKFPQVDVTLSQFPCLQEWQALMAEEAAVKACAFTDQEHDAFTTAWKGGDPDCFDVGLDE
ncbi:hypothetical protein ACOMHN_056141 [Nucella lapillus]